MKLGKLRLINRNQWLVQACEDKRVLHVGCTDWPLTESAIEKNVLLHKRLSKVASQLIGVDIDEEGLRKLSAMMPNHSFVAYSAENLDQCPALQGKDFDVIVAADILEHLSNPGLFLNAARKIMTHPESKLLITVPQAFSLKRILSLVFLRIENVHPDHVAYYSPSTLYRILCRAGLQSKEMYGFQWRNPTLRNWFANALVAPAVCLTRGRLCDSLAIVAISADDKLVGLNARKVSIDS